MPEHKREKRLLLGVLMILLSGFFYASYSLLVKKVQQDGVNLSQVIFFSFFISWLGLVPYLLYKDIHHLKTKHFSWLLFRSVSGILIIVFLGLALQTIPLVDAVLLNFSAPLFIPFVAYFILKTPINHRLWPIIGIGFIGIALILKPNKDVFHIGVIWGVLCGIAAAFSWVATRKLTHTEPVGRIMFYTMTIPTILTAIPALWKWQPIPSSIWYLIVLIGILYLGTLLFLTFGAKFLQVSLVGMLLYLTVVFSVILNWFVYNELPGLLTSLGIVLVVGSGILSVWIENKQLKKQR